MARAIRILLKTFAVACAACVALAMLTYYIVVAVNWNDREPSTLTRQWRQSYENRVELADSENAYVIAMAFTAPADNTNERLHDPALLSFREACSPRGTGCSNAFDNGDEIYDRWMAAQTWLLPRYQQLIGSAGWLDNGPIADLAAPLPKFAPIMDGQRILLLKARRLSMQGDYRAAHDLLESDLRFWRHVLASADTLITKMIASVALIRHFELGNLVLRKLDAAAAAQVMPAGWRTPLTDGERSMKRCMVGEWLMMSGLATSLNPIFRYELAINGEEEPTRRFGRTVVALLGAPLYQTQDSINRYADYLDDVVLLLDVPLDRYAESRAKSAELARMVGADAWPPRSLYNIVGSWMISESLADYSDYGARVADIEGVRRAALTAVTLRAANVQVANAGPALLTSELTEPYGDRPFDWAAAEGAIRFRGLQAGERGEHLLQY